MSSQPFALCLFAGAGGDSLGIEAAGYRVAGSIERDPDACATLRHNGRPVLQADVRAIEWGVFQGVDLVVGGPPCQPFSVGGRHRGAADDRDGLPYFVQAVMSVRPRVFIMENVPGLLFARHADYLSHVLVPLHRNYQVELRVLCAADFGLAQARRRLFIVGRSDGPVRWPPPTHDQHGVGGLPQWLTMADGLRWPKWPRSRRWWRDRHRGQVVPRSFTEAGDVGREWAWQQPATTVVASFRPDVVAAPGGRKRGDPPRQRRRGSLWVSPREGATLQGFPRRWCFVGSRSSVRRQIGNACPPALMAAVARAQLPKDRAAALTGLHGCGRREVT